MGGIRSTIPIRRLRAGIDPPELHRALWAKIDYTLRVTVSGAAGDQVLAFYLSMAADDGFDDGSWSSSETGLDFAFTDSAALCGMSSLAATHWLQIVLWTDTFVQRVVRDAGWELAALPRVPAIRNVLEARSPALVELRENLYSVSRRPRGRLVDDDDFHSDDGIPVLRLAELSQRERMAIECAAYSGACTCEYCNNALPFALLDEWQEGHLEDVTKTWTALDDLRTEEDAAGKAITSFTEQQWADTPLGPPELAALRSILAERDLEPPIARLVPMLLQRLEG